MSASVKSSFVSLRAQEAEAEAGRVAWPVCPSRNKFFVPSMEQQFRFAPSARQCKSNNTGADGAFGK